MPRSASRTPVHRIFSALYVIRVDIEMRNIPRRPSKRPPLVGIGDLALAPFWALAIFRQIVWAIRQTPGAYSILKSSVSSMSCFSHFM